MPVVRSMRELTSTRILRRSMTRTLQHPLGYPQRPGPLAELEDAPDSKPGAHSGVRVRLPRGLPIASWCNWQHRRFWFAWFRFEPWRGSRSADRKRTIAP